ncbi:MAG: hypothetical protein H6R15_1969 [Proteobacteria bacterium]|nr:hypothetical protein [Pseudomonadota bacterium]
MTDIQKKILGALALAVFVSSAQGQGTTTVSIGLDYAEGKYGEADKSRAWTIPLGVKYETDSMVLKMSIPYVSASGLAAAGGDLFAPVSQTQSGVGDLIASGAWTVYRDSATGLDLDLGGKVKFATADKSKDLLTTGENDYSLFADAYHPFGRFKLFGSLGWTLKGDPEGIDFRNPWFGNIGFSHQLSEADSWGALYDYRQKLSRHGSPISETTLFLSHKYSKQWKLHGYVVTGFSNASPDLALGTVLSYSY